ncbi:alpha/beta-hydrolase, partial [Athelia psychrophila]
MSPRSGFCLPSLGSDRAYCSFIASRTARPITVCDIDYRKAPEHPFPAALQDAEDIVVHITSQPTRFDVNNIFLSGFSAGGCIALSAAAMLGPERIKGVATFSAPVDLSKIYDAPEKTIVTGFVIPPAMHNLFFDAYLLPSQARKDSRVSPLFAPAESFPRHVYLACGNADNLYTPAEMLIQKLEKAGHGDAVFATAEREAHFFEKFAKDGSETAGKRDRMYADVVDMINRATGETRK